jgi:hypothetical protein
MQISTANLSGKWEVDVVPLQKRFVLEAGAEDAPLREECNSWCARLVPSVDAVRKVSTATVTVESVHLSGEADFGTFTISMYEKDLFGALMLDSNGNPQQGPADSPNFWLEGRMTLKVRFRDSQEILSLVSRKPVLQTGRAESWPPYNTVMRDISGPNEYVAVDNQNGPAVAVLWSGSITIGGKPSPFLAANIPIRSFQYQEKGAARATGGITLQWDDIRQQIPTIDHYHLYKRNFGAHDGGSDWKMIGGHIKENKFFDATYDGLSAVTYKVRQIMVDTLGDEVMGCGDETEFTVPARPHNIEQLYREFQF